MQPMSIWRTTVMAALPGHTIILFAILAGCASPPPTEEMSIKYDSVECPALIAQRDAIARQYPVLPPDETERIAMGALAGLRDTVEAGSADAKVAKGKITAMNDSLRRRQCAGANVPPKK
jgi:hypothetical protein